MNRNEFGDDGFGFGAQGRAGPPIERRIVLDDSNEPTSSGIQSGSLTQNETDSQGDVDPTILAKKLSYGVDWQKSRRPQPFGRNNNHLIHRPTEGLKEDDHSLLLTELEKMYAEAAEKKQIETTLNIVENETPPITVAADLEEFISQMSEWPDYPSNGDRSELTGYPASDPRVVAWEFISNASPALGGPDGCAVAQLYNPSYCTYFHARTASLPWTKLHVLNVIPLVMVATHFLIRGHKVVIFLPKYYENIYYCNFKTMCKVDNPSQFEVLRSLGLVEFIEMNTAPVKFLDEVIRERVKKVNACLVSSPHVERMYRQVRHYIWEEDDAGNNISVGLTDMIDCSSKADDGMVTPCFLGRNKLLVLHIGCTYFKGDDITKHEDRKHLYDNIAHEQILFYPPTIEHHEQHFAHDFQITMKEQIYKILKLSALQSLARKECLAVKTILSVGRHCAPWEMVRTFYQSVENGPEVTTSTNIIPTTIDKPIPESPDNETDEEDINSPIDFEDF